MEQYLGAVSQGLIAILLGNLMLVLAVAITGLTAFLLIKTGRYFVLSCRRELSKPEHKVLKRTKWGQVFVVPKKEEKPAKKAKNGSK